MEEVEELCQAATQGETAFEAADLICFVLIRCVAAGATVADIEHSPDAKARKITKKGDAKPQWVCATPEVIKPLLPKQQSTPAPPPPPLSARTQIGRDDRQGPAHCGRGPSQGRRSASRLDRQVRRGRASVSGPPSSVSARVSGVGRRCSRRY